jgi:hypothetical protein
VFAALLPDNQDTQSNPLALVYLVPLSALYAGATLLGLLNFWRKDWAFAAVVTSPLVFSLLLSLAGKYPLGGGRTDLYLAPIIVVLAANSLAIVVSQLHARLLAIVLGTALCIPALLGTRAIYPQEDLRSLVNEIERTADIEDKIMVYPETAYMYALYSGWDISVIKDPLSMTGFTPTTTDTRVSMMPGFEFQTDLHAEGLAVCMSQVLAAIEAKPPHIWLVASTYFAEDQLPEIDATMVSQGWQVDSSIHFENAVAQQWKLVAASPSSHD